MPSALDLLKIGGASFLSRIGGGKGVDGPAMLQNMQNRRIEQQFMDEGGMMQAGPSAATMPGMPKVGPVNTPEFAMNIPTIQQKSVIDSMLRLGQIHVENGQVTKGLGMIQEAEKMKADIKAAEAEAAAKRAQIKLENTKVVVEAGKLSPQLAERMAKALNIGISMEGISYNVHGDYLRGSIGGIPHVYIQRMGDNGKPVVDAIPINMDAQTMLLLGGVGGKGGALGPEMLGLALKHKSGLIDLNNPENQPVVLDAYKKDAALLEDPAGLEREKLDMQKMEAYNRMANRNARTGIAAKNATNYMKSVKVLKSEAQLKRINQLIEKTNLEIERTKEAMQTPGLSDAEKKTFQANINMMQHHLKQASDIEDAIAAQTISIGTGGLAEQIKKHLEEAEKYNQKNEAIIKEKKKASKRKGRGTTATTTTVSPPPPVPEVEETEEELPELN